MKRVRNHANGRDWALLAAHADQAINNTSLILVFQVGSKYLLFPEDAQWGPWQHILKNPQFCDLLSRTTFYKVSHHGSRLADLGSVASIVRSDEATTFRDVKRNGEIWSELRIPVD